MAEQDRYAFPHFFPRNPCAIRLIAHKSSSHLKLLIDELSVLSCVGQKTLETSCIYNATIIGAERAGQQEEYSGERIR